MSLVTGTTLGLFCPNNGLRKNHQWLWGKWFSIVPLTRKVTKNYSPGVCGMIRPERDTLSFYEVLSKCQWWWLASHLVSFEKRMLPCSFPNKTPIVKAEPCTWDREFVPVLGILWDHWSNPSQLHWSHFVDLSRLEPSSSTFKTEVPWP